MNRGRLQVVGDNGKTVMASLKAGSYFGEISILNMGTAGNGKNLSPKFETFSSSIIFIFHLRNLVIKPGKALGNYRGQAKTEIMSK